MRSYSPKRQKRNVVAATVRDELKHLIRRCEVCLKTRDPEYLACHEIANGSGLRLRALDKPTEAEVTAEVDHLLQVGVYSWNSSDEIK